MRPLDPKRATAIGHLAYLVAAQAELIEEAPSTPRTMCLRERIDRLLVAMLPLYSLDEIKQRIIAAHVAATGKKTRAARTLGCSRRTVINRLRKAGA